MVKSVNFEEVCGGPYFRCLKCGAVVSSSRKSKKDELAGVKCSCSNTASFEPWPGESVSGILKMLITESVSTKAEQVSYVLLSDVVIKILFRDIVNAISKFMPGLLALPKYINISFPIEDPHSKIIEEVTDMTVDSLFESKGFGDFLMEWKLISTRIENLSLHPGSHITENELDVATHLASDSLRVFSIIYNEVLALAKKAKNPNARALLIVDDEEEITMKIARFMSKRGLKVFTAQNGKDAIQLYKDNMPGYVLLDMALPDMDGMSVLKKILGIDKTAKVYFVTGIAGEAFIKQIQNSGALGYIPKPIALEALYEILTKKS